MFAKLIAALATAVLFLTAYRVVYTVIGFFAKSKTFPPTDNRHSFGIVIAARDESEVIGRLIESVKAQDYDSELYRIFVVADNCTDNTADICRRMGATVYERNDPQRARKGYALQYLFKKIDEDFGIDCVDGYIIFDADNLLRSNYLTEMNKAFDTGADVCIGYRNTKNISENAISAAYGIHFLRSSATWHRPRTLFGLSTHIAGTGWAVKSELIRDGWSCTFLTEDSEFTMKNVAEGHVIEYCEAAEFYDEQPHELSTALRQRTRWIKGRLACFFRYAHSLISGMFSIKSRLRTRICCYDMFFYLFPGGLFTAIFSTLPAAVHLIIDIVKKKSVLDSLLSVSTTILISLSIYWIGTVLTGLLVVIRERDHIHCPLKRMMVFLMLWPWFDFVEVPLAVVSLLHHVEWKPTKHDRPVSVDEIESKKK